MSMIATRRAWLHTQVDFGAMTTASVRRRTSPPGSNVPAILIVLAVVTWLLVIGTDRERRASTPSLVAIKIAGPHRLHRADPAGAERRAISSPFAPNGWFGPEGASGMHRGGGLDLLCLCRLRRRLHRRRENQEPAAQRAHRPDRLASAICTIFYLLVASGAIGAIGSQPVMGRGRLRAVAPGSAAIDRGVAPPLVAGGALNEPLVCSREALVHVLHDDPLAGDRQRSSASPPCMALPSVILMMMFGQTRIFFVMARDGLLPESFVECIPKLTHAARRHHLHRHRRRQLPPPCFPVGPAGRHLQLGHAVRLLHGVDSGDGAAHDRSAPQAALQHAGRRVSWRRCRSSAASCSICSSAADGDHRAVPVWGALGLLIYFG